MKKSELLKYIDEHLTDENKNYVFLVIDVRRNKDKPFVAWTE